MQRPTIVGFVIAFALIVSAAVFVSGQQLPGEPQHTSGASITPAFEGWFNNQDGTKTLLVGYFNRNRTEEIDIPIGPNNHFEPGPADRGQPTHFLVGRQWGVFGITVPKDFPARQEVTWVLTANGQQTKVPFYLHNDYEIAPFVGILNNTPPVLRFVENGPSAQGPLDLTIEREASKGTPLPLNVWVTDDGKSSSASARIPANRDLVTVTWAKYRGPGEVTFDNAKPKAEKTSTEGTTFAGKATTNAKFAEAGDYMLQVTINDLSGVGGGGFQCCWTTGLVKVTVK